MTLRKKRILITTAVVVTVITVMAGSQNRQPVYQGKALSRWLFDCPAFIQNQPRVVIWNSSGKVIRGEEMATQAEWDQTAEAVLSMGESAVPSLLELIQREDSYLKSRFLRLKRKFNWTTFDFRTDIQYQQKGLLGIRMLGEKAGSGVLELERIYREHSNSQVRLNAFLALQLINPQKYGALNAVVQPFEMPVPYISPAGKSIHDAGTAPDSP